MQVFLSSMYPYACSHNVIFSAHHTHLRSRWCIMPRMKTQFVTLPGARPECGQLQRVCSILSSRVHMCRVQWLIFSRSLSLFCRPSPAS